MSGESADPLRRSESSLAGQKWYERIRRRIETRLATSLYEQLERRNAIVRPGWSLSVLATYLIAITIHLCSLTFLVGGIVLFVREWRNPVVWVVVLVLFGIAVLGRPRFGKLPDDAIVVTRSEAPRLYGLVDRVADELRGPRIDTIVLSSDFNAAAGSFGWRHRPVLVLGLPLWNVATPQERVFLLGHEIGHFVNGDVSRGYVVNSAMLAVGNLYVLVRSAAEDTENFVVRTYTRPFVILVSLLPLAVFAVFWLTLARSRQWAEYVADQLGARVAGSAGASMAARKLLVGEKSLRELATSTRRTALNEIWPHARAVCAAYDEEVYTDLLRAAVQERARADDLHPPTDLRIRLLSVGPKQPGSVRLSPTESDAIDVELRSGYQSVAHELRDLDRTGLFY